MDELVIKIAESPLELPQVYRIRYLVFQIEQGVEESLEFDRKDEKSQHILVYWQGNPVGTARIRMLNSETAKVERVAVLSAARGLASAKKLWKKRLSF